MRIVGWDIDGYGLFANHQARDLSPSLVVAYGPNESGKSTLLAFLRGVLFGFPDRRSRERLHEPLRGGLHGGRLYLEADGGVWTVERHVAPTHLRVTLPDNSEGTEGDLRRLLGNADRELFKNVFAFGLEELQSFRSLDAEGVRDRIFSAGVVGAGRSARQAIQTLDRRRDGLLKLRGSSAEINRLENELRELEQKLKEAQHAAERYPLELAERDQLAEEASGLDKKILAATAERTRYENLVGLWPVWNEQTQALDELGSLPEARTEEASEEQLTALLRDAAAARKAVEERRRELERIRERLKRLSLDETLPPVAERVKGLFARLSAYEEKVARLADLRRERREDERRLTEELSRLGPKWDRSCLASFDTSIPATEEVRGLGATLSNAEGREIAADQRVVAARERLDMAARKVQLLQQTATAQEAVRTATEIDGDEAALRQLRVDVADLEKARAVRETAETLSRTAPRLSMPKIAVFALAGLMGVGAVASVILGQVAGAVLLGVAVLVLAIFAVVTRPGEVGHGQDPARHEGALVNEVKSRAASLELSGIPGLQEIEERGAKLRRESEARREADRRAEELGLAAEEQEQASAQVSETDRRLTEAREDLARRGVEWNAWKAERSVPATLTPDGVNDFFATVRGLRETLGRLARVEEEETGLEDDVRQFWEEAQEVLGMAGAAGPDLSSGVRSLYERVREDEKSREDQQRMETGRAGADRDLAEAEEEIARVEGDLGQLFADAGTADEKEFRQRLAHLRRRHELEETAAACDRRIRERIGVGDEAQHLLAELATGEVSRWEAAEENLARRLSHLDDNREQALRRHQDAVTRVGGLEASADVARVGTEREGRRQELLEAIGEWQVLTLAKSLVGETQARYERERQPRVIARAAESFTTVTGKHYERLLARDGTLEVVDDRGLLVDAADLSRGATEQLYLCLRFSLVDEFSEHAVSLPVIMDEVLVNFDPERVRPVVGAVAELSSRHQILLFTCHPWVVNLVRDEVVDAQVIELERFGGSSPLAPRRDAGRTDEAGSVGDIGSVDAEGHAERILRCLRDADHPMGKSEILNASRIPEEAWTSAIQTLVDEGSVERFGERRGTTYRAH